jgi:large subunit ribosomal protein L35
MQKTKKSVVKRFKISASGRVFAYRAGRRHLLQTKSAKRRRALGRRMEVSATRVSHITRCLPFGGR